MGLIRGESFGRDEVHVSHLQFADDTMIFLKPKIDYVLNLKRILRCFELSSGLKINFHKSCLMSVGKNKRRVELWAGLMNCRAVDLPILYLGLHLGARSRARSFWDPVVTKIENRLAPWKRKCISKSGRLILIKSILNSIPMVFLSVFKMPIGVAKRIVKLQRGFLWGDEVVKRKVHAVHWDSVCCSKKKGGLGIGKMVDKNNGMIAKWIWRFGNEGDSIWKSVICSKYGINKDRLVWDWSCPRVPSQFVRAVVAILKPGSRLEQVCNVGFKEVLGSGKGLRLW